MLHEFVSAHRQEILSLCLSELRSAHPSGSDEDVIGDIPDFLNEVIDALKACSEGAGIRISDPAPRPRPRMELSARIRVSIFPELFMILAWSASRSAALRSRTMNGLLHESSRF